MPGTGLLIGTSLPIFGSIIDDLIHDDDKVFVLLADQGSPHNFQPRPSDILNLQRSNLLLLGDSDLDGWASGLATTEVQFLTDFIAERSILVSNGYRNPHFWMDPVMIQEIVHPVAELLCKLRSETCMTYQQRARELTDSLEVLNSEIAAAVSSLHGRSVITSHPFFDYFLARYNIRLIVTLEPIPGREPSPAKIIETLNTVKKEHPVGLVAQTGLPDTAIDLIRQETDLPIVYVNPVGSQGQTYVNFIRSTAKILMGLDRN